MSFSLRIRDISKRYRIGTGVQSSGDSEQNTLWALKDISFDVKHGEAVAVVGRNGAGKSTLLKILSRITSPTEGEVEVYGSIASLLEVGTGFHPDLTGRENIYLNGALLGMSRKTITKHFDEIVRFADTEKFLDTPVKRYSSGMYVRLAFAVAAHLESEILLLDEVLAVGDVAFQKRCLAKMDDIASRGRTVIFVSHNLGAVRQFCPRTVLIDGGRLVGDGPTGTVLKEFMGRLRGTNIDANTHLRERADGHSGAARFTSFRVEDSAGNERYEFHTGETIRIHAKYAVCQNIEDLCLFFAFVSETTGEYLSTARYVLSSSPKVTGESGEAVIEFPEVKLLPREYLPYIWLGSRLGLPYDRLDYRLTSCPPITISPKESGPEVAEGYFTMPSRLLTG